VPLPRFENLPPERRRAILEAAADEFAEHGFEGASFNRIIASAKISKGAMYYYFADKADAYGAVMDDVFDRSEVLVQDIETPTDAASFWAAFEVGFARIGAMLFSDPRLGALARTFYQGGVGATYRRLMARSTEWIQRLLVLGQSVGAVRSDVPVDLLIEATMGMLVGMDRWFAEAMERLPPEELLPLGPKMLELMQDLLAPRREGALETNTSLAK